MADQRKLERWAEKLLDTGKRNYLINFKDTRASSAELVFPDCDATFNKCSIGASFEVFDPKIQEDIELDDGVDGEQPKNEKKLSRKEFIDRYSPFVKKDRLLLYAQTPNPIAAVKNIAKKARQMADETGINVAYLAFGFMKWKEKEKSDVFYRAPLLLVHVDLITGGILDPIKIEVIDDDIVVNPTFDYLLQADYGVSLPQYEDGESLSSYLGKTASIFRKMGWEVLAECKLGIFSFLKINMYEDLKNNTDAILENENVKVLLGEPISPFEITSFTENVSVVDNPLIDLHTVVDADSSQIEAIEMAKSGKSFVLQGPPGTGKSQTITNIIAECLHDEKRVLFVSEKQAALNVVFDKLKKADLSDFCLELHSYKAKKKAVIEELNRTLEVPRISVSSSAQEEIRQKEIVQTRLDEYASALHLKRNVINKSLYQLFELYSAQRKAPELELPINDIHTKGQDYLLQAVKLLEQYAEYVPSIGINYRRNPWYGLKAQQWSYNDRNQLKADLEALSSGYKNLQGTTTRIRAKYETPELNYMETLRWQSLLAFSAESDVVTPAMLSRNVFENALPSIEEMQQKSEALVPLRDQFYKGYLPTAITELDGKEISIKLNGQFSSFFSRIFNSEYKNLIAGILPHTIERKKLNYQQAVSFADQLMKLQILLKDYAEIEETTKGCIGSCYNGPDTDWQHVRASMDVLKGYHSEENHSFGLLARMSETEFKEYQKEFEADSQELTNELTSIDEAKKRVSVLFSPETLDLEGHSYNYCLNKVNGCLQDFEKLANWIGFMDLLQKLKDLELEPFIDLIIAKGIKPENVVGAYRRLFYKQWIEYVLFSVPVLSSFSRIIQDQAVNNFGKKDRLQYAINKKEIKAELSQKRPDLNLIAGGSSVAILRREGQKKRKQMPIRTLMSTIGDLVQILKPCFLMSPLSVSTFLDPEKLSFDTVIFDEASQIFPQDAIGAIYRGKQVIVVGDSKQMPPSNFFNASTDIDVDDEEYSDVADFESILDICSSVFNTERLAWHYRSHYEQLIAFSNLNFYNNHLVTFPSSSTDHKGIGVDYYHVDGVFDRKSKTNRAEAEFVIDLVYRNIEKYPDRSLGVVAFSVAQQNLIDKLLSKKREEDPSYEWFFKNDIPDPFFIKNLESVQGDERDTIIFSVAYARDSQGRFIHNFGPLNREGGERRLNVAITRAKDNVQLVASIRHTDINLNNSGAEGVRLLKAYLDYAQNGEKALERAVTVSPEDSFDSDFEQEVCEFLRDKGFTVDTQVGCSGYKIDLGIRKPEGSNYVLAVECDGATYHSSKNARDRDSLRQNVLENMGWQFYRIWSTDWYKNKAVEKKNLEVAAKQALESNKPSGKAASRFKTTNKSIKDIEKSVQDKFVSEVNERQVRFAEYKEVDALRAVRSPSNHYDFHKGILEILKSEAPLSEEYLLKRIIYYFGRTKVTQAAVRDYERKIYGCRGKGIIRRNGFLYLMDMDEIKLRVPGDKRDIKYISPEELADGLLTLVKTNITVSKDSLYKSLTNLLGFSRTGEIIIRKYDEALDLLVVNKKVHIENGLVTVV